MRYAMGKSACMPVVVSDYIKRHLQLLDDKFLALATNDIRHHFEDYGEHEPNTNLWQELLELLEAQQRERVTRPAKESRPCPVCGKLLEVMSVADNRHSPGGFDVIAHCWSCGSNFEWFCDNELRTFYMAERKLKPQPLPPDHPRRNCCFNKDGHLCVKNLSAFWVPELTVTEVIHGTVYTVTGSYEGTENFVCKLERITSKKFAEKMEDSE